MEVIHFDSASGLLEAAGPFLVAREAEHNLPLGILLTLRDEPGIYTEPPYLAAVMDGPAIALVVVRTPPYGPVLSEPGVDPGRVGAALDALVADLWASSADLPTVVGPRGTVRSFAARWSAVSSRPARLEMEERIYRLSRVLTPPDVSGRWRLAEPADRELLLAWTTAFHEEALPSGAPMGGLATLVDRWVRRADRFAYLWEAGARPVSLVVAGARTPSGRRIGPVYTPPSDRGHGYATALTAAASRDQLERGVMFCFLFTDLSNPTSNAIYQRIGYEPVADVEQYRFER